MGDLGNDFWNTFGRVLTVTLTVALAAFGVGCLLVWAVTWIASTFGWFGFGIAVIVFLSSLFAFGEAYEEQGRKQR